MLHVLIAQKGQDEICKHPPPITCLRTVLKFAVDVNIMVGTVQKPKPGELVRFVVLAFDLVTPL